MEKQRREREVKLEILVGFDQFEEKDARDVLEGKETVEDLVRDGTHVHVFRRGMIGVIRKIDDKKVVIQFNKKCGLYKVYHLDKTQEFSRKHVQFRFAY